MAYRMLVDIDRCIGCWTCSMACKVGNHLPDEDYRIEIKTHGSGQGIDRPAGVYPDLKMWWQPIYLKSCTFCAPRVAEDEQPFCMQYCPTRALAFGKDDDPTSEYSQALERVRERGAREFTSDIEDTKDSIIYASTRI